MARGIAGPQLDREVPEAFTQMAQPSREVRRKRDRSRRVVDVLIALFLVIFAANTVMIAANLRNAADLKASIAEDSSPSFRSRYDVLGAQVVESWMSGAQPVVDTIEGVVWPTAVDGKSVGVDVESVGYLGGRTVSIQGTDDFHESLRYSVVATDGAQFIATIDMGIISTGDDSPVRPVLLSAPLIEPRASVNVVAGAGRPGWSSVSVEADSPLAKQIALWAQAWTANDQAALKSLAGDSSNSQYYGLTSSEAWEVGEGSAGVVWAVTRPDDGLVVVRVTWDMTADAQATDALVLEPTEAAQGDGPNKTSAPTEKKLIRQSADLLIADAATGLPKVVAWGAPGTYESLTVYQNADQGEGE